MVQGNESMLLTASHQATINNPLFSGGAGVAIHAHLKYYGYFALYCAIRLLIILGIMPFVMERSSWAQNANYWRAYKAVDGLSESSSLTVTLSSRGKVWVKHAENPQVSCLDGYQVTHYPSPGSGPLRIIESPEGKLWSSHAGGLVEFNQNQWILHPIRRIADENTQNPARSVRPVSFLPLGGDRVLYLLPDELLEYSALTRKSQVLQKASNGRIGRFTDWVEAGNNQLWITGEFGIAKAKVVFLPQGSQLEWHPYEAPQQLEAAHFQRPTIDPDGMVIMVGEIISQQSKAIVFFDGQTWKMRHALRGKMRQAWRDANHDLWAYSINSLVRIDEQGNEIPENGCPFAGQFFDVAVEPKGSFWIATPEGVARYASLPWHPVVIGEMINEPIHAILGDKNNPHCFWGVGTTHLFQHERGLWRSFNYPSEWELEFQSQDNLFQLNDGRLAIASFDRCVLFNPKTDQFERILHPSERTSKAIGQLPDGELILLVGGPKDDLSSFHLEKFDGHQYHPFSIASTRWSLGAYLHFCYVAPNQDCWLGGTSGIGLLRDGKLQIFNRDDGDIPEAAYCLLNIGDGRIWVGGAGKIHEFNGSRWSIIRRGIDRVHSIAKVPDNSIWVASGDGLYRTMNDSWILHSVEEGLPSRAVYAIHMDQRGQLWAGTARGLGAFNSSADIDPPHTSIITPNNQSEFLADIPIMILLSGQDKWKFTPSDRLLYSYRVGNSAWSTFSSASTVSLKELTPGKQRIEARAMDRLGNIDKNPAIFNFTVFLPWYLESRLLISVFAGLVGAVILGAFAVNRHLRLKKSYAEVEKIVAERTRQLEMANQALVHSQKMRALGTLTAGIAHDFNSILSIVKGSVQIIENDPKDTDKILVRTNRIKTVVDQGSAIVKAMLGYSRGTNNTVAPANLNTVIEETLKLLGDQFLNKIEVRRSYTSEVIQVLGVQELLQQMLLNLVLNAIEAMSGSGMLTIATEVSQSSPLNMVLEPSPSDYYACLMVKDTGSGMAPDIQSRVFEPFFSTRAMSSLRGTVLGLTMVHEFAKYQGYGLRVESSMGQGSVFTIVMPMLPPQ